MRDISWSEIFDRIIIPSIANTLEMLFFCFIFSSILGFTVAVALYMTQPGGLRENKAIYGILNGGISILRSFPFMILMVSIIPLTRIKEVNPALVDAAKSFGASDWQIIFGVVLSEALPSLITGSILSIIHVLNLTTVAGAIGAGGLGASALQYGYQSNNDKVMYSIIVILICMVILIQYTGDRIYKKIKE